VKGDGQWKTCLQTDYFSILHVHRAPQQANLASHYHVVLQVSTTDCGNFYWIAKELTKLHDRAHSYIETTVLLKKQS
jgi:hypothetical protein